MLIILPFTASAADAIDVGDFVSNAEEFTDKPVTIRGFVVDVCLHRGCKLFLRDLRDDSDSMIRIEQSPEISPFNADIMGDTVEIQGVARATKIDKTYLDEWEAEVRGAGRAGAPEELGGCSSEDQCEEEDAETIALRKQTLERIASYRERIASNGRGYLLSVWVDCTGLSVKS